MEEEKDYNNQGTSRSGPVRPSMVVMTSKLLNVSEGIAAMNIRIACGVAFCCVLLVATFVVNIIAFNYAKDNEVKGGALVDKSTGEKVSVRADSQKHVRPVSLTLDKDALSKLQTVGVDLGNGFFTHLKLEGFSVLACPSTVSAELQEKYCSFGQTFIGLATQDLMVVFNEDDNGLTQTLLAPEDKGFFTAALEETAAQAESRRHLTHRNGVGVIRTTYCVNEENCYPPDCDDSPQPELCEMTEAEVCVIEQTDCTQYVHYAHDPITSSPTDPADELNIFGRK